MKFLSILPLLLPSALSSSHCSVSSHESGVDLFTDTGKVKGEDFNSDTWEVLYPEEGNYKIGECAGVGGGLSMG